jgi:hypothetical protein
MTLFITIIILLIIINGILLNNFDKKIKLSNKLYKSIIESKKNKR